jgi:hypothetical protein
LLDTCTESRNDPMVEQVIRHPNGGAQKIGLEVHVSGDSFCNRVSNISGCSTILHSTVTDSRVDGSQVFSSTVRACSIGDSVASESVLALVLARDCTLDRVQASGYRDGGLFLKDVVAENCELYGNWTLEGNFRIHEGVWRRAPRAVRITGDNGVDVGITECKPGFAMMACWCKPISTWLHAGPRLGRLHKWSEEQINTARLFYEELADCPLP